MNEVHNTETTGKQMCSGSKRENSQLVMHADLLTKDVLAVLYGNRKIGWYLSLCPRR